MKHFSGFALACFGLSLAAAKTQAQTAYTIQDLGSLGRNDAIVSGLNNNGELVANLSNDGRQPLTGLYSGGAWQDITAKAGLNVGNINDNGLVATSTGVPVMFGDGYTGQAAVYNTRTGMTQLVGAGGPNGSIALGVNQNGDAAGTIALGGSQSHAALYRSGQTIDLGLFPGGGYTEATAINSRDEVVGKGSLPNETHPFLYSGGVLRDLGTLPGGHIASATGLNDSGTVVGYSEGTVVTGLYHAFVYQNGAMQDLGTLGGPGSDAEGINNAGVIVGSAQMQSATGFIRSVPFIYRDGVMQNLFDMIPDASAWSDGFGEAINDNGQIAGEAFHDGGFHIFLATPVAVPEPGSLLTFGVGMGVLLLAARRKRASSSLT